MYSNLLIIILICSLSISGTASTIHITEGHIDPIPIAITDFSCNKDNGKMCSDIRNVLLNDLSKSGIFKTISKSAFIEEKIGVSHIPLFVAWRQIGVDLLLNTKITISTSKLKIKFILWDCVMQKKILENKFTMPKTKWRKIAHEISNRIYKSITGYEGYFTSRIVYVAESGSYLKRIKRLAIMDQDGENHEYLTDGSDIVLTPRFSPNGKKILYLSYKDNIPQIYVFDILNRSSKLLGAFNGMSFAPRFSPDGKYIIMSIAKGGNTHIFEMNLSNKKIKQLTKGNGINTSPGYSWDGRRIVYNSDIGGKRQIFIMNHDGSDRKRISSGYGVYAEPNWSSKDYIAFTKIGSSGFGIGIINGDKERIIATGYLVESPSWSKNGRVIAFTKSTPAKRKKKGINRIYTIDFTGNNERIIPTPGDASDPDWSN